VAVAVAVAVAVSVSVSVACGVWRVCVSCGVVWCGVPGLKPHPLVVIH
jgi:hypothetical protein